MNKERKLLQVADLQLNEGQLGWLPKNPRQWTQDSVNKAKDSLERDPDFLDDRPLLVVPHDGAFVVYAGNMRLTAARELGVEALPCVSYEPESIEDRDTIKRRAILDNGDFGDWDWDALANEWDELPLGDWGVPAWKGAEGNSEQKFDVFNDVKKKDDNVNLCGYLIPLTPDEKERLIAKIKDYQEEYGLVIGFFTKLMDDAEKLD